MACPTAQRVGTCGATIASLCPLRPFRTGSRLGGKKAQARMDTDFLDWALADFSGSVAADALYDGSFCILSAVDRGPHQKAARRARRRVVHPAVSVCPTSPEHNRTQDPVARQPWIAPVTRATSSHGTGVCVIRSALSDPDRSGQTGQTAASAPAVPTVGGD